MSDAEAFGARRHRMVEEQVRRRGIRDPEVLAALHAVPRHLFVPAARQAAAYDDNPVPIGWGQTISQPYMVALMTSLLQVDVRSRVLEIGAGSGYQTAVLAEVAGEVWAIERLAPLAERARPVLERLGYGNAHLVIGDGTRGWPEHAPFDGVLVAAAAERPPAPLLAQLADGGRLVMPVGHPGRDQVLTIIERAGQEFIERHDTLCRFVPLIEDRRERGPADGGEGGETQGGEAAPGTPPPELDPPPAAAADGAHGEEAPTMKAVLARVHGTVQGVYYRASAREEGRRLGLAGWVRNRADGSVELHLQGEPAAVDAMLGWCRVGPPAAVVGWVDVGDAQPDPSLTTFEVR